MKVVVYWRWYYGLRHRSGLCSAKGYDRSDVRYPATESASASKDKLRQGSEQAGGQGQDGRRPLPMTSCARHHWHQGDGLPPMPTWSSSALPRIWPSRRSCWARLDSSVQGRAPSSLPTLPLCPSPRSAPGPRSVRIIGMHFFNPAPAMKLVEVIAGVQHPRRDGRDASRPRSPKTSARPPL